MEPPREMPHQPSAVEAFLAAQCFIIGTLVSVLSFPSFAEKKNLPGIP